ncbi:MULTISPECIES: hypothetical protein [unclassified Streptomyces]|uniref:hypothetical protein n=1 Tax=unclassified Streptomyces TaxID=2593676 RepID=UPI0022522DDA|nr:MULTISPECIES: hypothetical protein [unclassified Streptomyces]MCX5328283.1 hypothetical protein [Streptomyces sp. NBC_00140]MCX5357694.1 hypothetical protein [Streptomyces sp. NBC_00124]
MRTWLGLLSKFTAAVAVVASLAIPGATTASAQEDATFDQAAPLACGTRSVFLDGIRAIDVLEEGERDEVYIVNDAGVKIWPTTADYVSMAEGQRVEVDKCVPLGEILRLWDDDGALNPNDFMGIMYINTEETRDDYFDNGSSRYRLGIVA